MGCGVEDQVWLILPHHVLHPVGVAHGTDEHLEIQLRVIAFQLLLNVVGVVFVDVHDDELPGIVLDDLAAQL